MLVLEGFLVVEYLYVPSQDALEVMLGTQWLNNAEGF